MPISQPGKKVRGSKTGVPIMAVFDLLGKRWTLSIIWYLNDDVLTFRELQQRCDNVSPSVLNTRIKELRTGDIIYNAENGYALTDRGKDLLTKLRPLGEWSATWAKEVFDYTKPDKKNSNSQK